MGSRLLQGLFDGWVDHGPTRPAPGTGVRSVPPGNVRPRHVVCVSLPLDYMLPQDGYTRPCQTRSSTNAGAVSPTRRGGPEDRQNSVVEKAESSRCLFKFWLCDLGLVA